MPEIWLNYGITDVVLDIRAENLEQNIDSDGRILNDSQIREKISIIDITKPLELAVLHNSKAVQKIISVLFSMCEEKSIPFPKILAEKQILPLIKSGLPEGCSINEFESENLSNSSLFFIGEMELDGLFGYETIATRLIRKFGTEHMLSAFAKRQGNLPTPGQLTESLTEAKKFADTFEIKAIEIVANSKGIVDFSIGHPSSTMSLNKIMESLIIKDIEHQKSMIISTGKEASNCSLDKSLSSLWNCYNAIKKDGLAILVAECGTGLGSEALQQYVEGRLTVDKLKNPTKYINGMENLLYLTQIQNNFQLGLVSILPDFYTKKLNMIPLDGIKQGLDYILKTQGARQKVSVISDGSRVLLR